MNLLNEKLLKKKFKLLCWFVITLVMAVGNVGYKIIYDRSFTDKVYAADFDPAGSIVPLVSGYNHGALLLGNGTVEVWGDNSYGELGIGNTINQSSPVFVPGLTAVKQVVVGNGFTLTLMSDGSVMSWGNNSSGQLGLGNTINQNMPTKIPSLSGAKLLAAGGSSAFAIMNDGTVKAWGLNSNYQLGIGNNVAQNTPVTISGLTGVKQIACGGEHTLALMSDGTIQAWGDNSQSQSCPQWGNTVFASPSVVSGLSNVKQLAAGWTTSFALMSDGTVMAWGSNSYGQLGIGTSSQKTQLTTIPGLSGVKQIVAGNSHTLALMSDGTVEAWGNNESKGVLGLGNTVNFSISPAIIPGFTGVKQLTAGQDFTLALMSDYTVKSWGFNNNGQLGLGNITNVYTPTLIPNLKYNIKPSASIQTPVQNYISTGIDDNVSPTISVSDADNNNLTCKYYLDYETNPRDTQSATNTTTPKTVVFNSINLGTLPEGAHTFRFDVYDGYDTTSVTVNFTISRTKSTLSVSNINQTKVDLTASDPYPADAQYQLVCGNKYVDSQGELTPYPTWITLSNKKITIVGLTPGTRYSFQCKERKFQGGETSLSSAVQATTLAGALGIPNDFTTNATSESAIRLTWSPVNGADGYNVECDGVQKDAGTNLYYDDINLTAMSTHKYRISSRKASVQSDWSTYVLAITKANPLVAPQNVVITPAGTSVNITWQAVTNASGYEIDLDGVVTPVGNKTTYIHTGLKSSTTHTYRVRAKNTAVIGAWSNLQTIVTTNGLPGVPTNITAIVTNNIITLNWIPGAESEYCEVVETINGQDGQPVNVGSNNIFENKGLQPGSTHIYKVHGVNSIGIGTWSSPIVVTTYMEDTPQNIQTTSTDTTITFNWTSINDAVDYDVMMNNQIYTGTNLTTYIASGLQPETIYSCSVRARNSLGTGGWSIPMTVLTLPTKPAVPTNVSAVITDNTVIVKWDAVTSAEGYDVELDGIVLENDNTTTYENDDLVSNEVHTYRVRARNSAIAGDWSDLQTISTLPGKPVAPNNIVVKSTQTGATITWDPVQGATGYDIEVFDGTNTTVFSNITDTSFTHRRIALNAECKYRIRTENVEGISDWSGYIVNNAIKAICKKNNTMDLGLASKDVTDFSPYTMIVTYNSGLLDVADLCSLTGSPELQPGKIDGTDITVKEFTPGKIVFVVNKVVNPGEAWTGVVNSIKFKAKQTGGTTFTYTVFIAPQP